MPPSAVAGEDQLGAENLTWGLPQSCVSRVLLSYNDVITAAASNASTAAFPSLLVFNH